MSNEEGEQVEEQGEEVKSRLPAQKLEAIKRLAQSGMTNVDIAGVLNISTKTVAIYRPSEEQSKEGTKEEAKKEDEATNISGETYHTLYILFEEGKGKVEAVIQTSIPASIVDKVYKYYCSDKGTPHPKQIAERMDFLEEVLKSESDNVGNILNAHDKLSKIINIHTEQIKMLTDAYSNLRRRIY